MQAYEPGVALKHQMVVCFLLPNYLKRRLYFSVTDRCNTKCMYSQWSQSWLPFGENIFS